MFITESDRIIDRIISNIMIEEAYNNAIDDYDMKRMSSREQAAAVSKDLGISITSVISRDFDTVSRAATRITHKQSPTNVPFIAGQRLREINPFLSEALMKAFRIIGRRVDRACDNVDNPGSYRRDQNHIIRTEAVWTVMDLIVNSNLLNVDENVLRGEVFRQFMLPNITDLVNDCADAGIDHRSFREQDRAGVRDAFRGHGPVRAGKSRGIYGNWTTTRG